MPRERDRARRDSGNLESRPPPVKQERETQRVRTQPQPAGARYTQIACCDKTFFFPPREIAFYDLNFRIFLLAAKTYGRAKHHAAGTAAGAAESIGEIY